jgi:[ribosomal protein S5]-alanine N-acetyltransferase
MTDHSILQTERFELRVWGAEDLDDLVGLHCHVDVSRYLSRDGMPWTRNQIRDRMAGWMRDFHVRGISKLKLLRRDDGRFVGRAGFSLCAEVDQFELGYSLAPEFWGRGYATEIAAALARHFFRLNIRDCFIAFAHVDNAASLNVLEKIGMRFERTGPMNGLPCHIYAKYREDLERDAR